MPRWFSTRVSTGVNLATSPHLVAGEPYRSPSGHSSRVWQWQPSRQTVDGCWTQPAPYPDSACPLALRTQGCRSPDLLRVLSTLTVIPAPLWGLAIGIVTVIRACAGSE